MKKAFTVAVSFALATWLFAAADEQEHVKWMKSIGQANGALKKGVEAKDADVVAKAAASIASNYKSVTAFYTDRHVEDAVKLAKQGEAAAADITAAISAKDFDKAADGVKALGATCAGCHREHREKGSDGSYKIK